VKNKVAPPFRQAEFDILYGEGISREGEIVELGTNHHILEKTGAWYTYGKDRIGQGKDNARDYLKENPKVAQEIEAKIRAAAGAAAQPAASQPRAEAKAEARKAAH
jgi:recombination protein RecA